jgi:hypothetical protein
MRSLNFVEGPLYKDRKKSKKDLPESKKCVSLQPVSKEAKFIDNTERLQRGKVRKKSA